MRHFRIILLVLILNLFSYQARANASEYNELHPHISFTLINNASDNQSYTAKLVLNFNDVAHAGRWKLAFNSIKPILSVDQGSVTQLKQGGDFYLIQFELPKDSKQFTINLKGKWSVKHETDAPSGYFLVDEGDANHLPFTIPVSSDINLPAWTPGPGEDEVSKNFKKMHTSIENNPIDTVLTADNTLIVPLPAEIQRNNGEFILKKSTQIIYANPNAHAAATFFAEAIQPAMGVFLSVASSINHPLESNTIFLTSEGTERFTEKQIDEGYILEVNASSIIIRARSDAGFFYGVQSLRQLLPPAFFSEQLQSGEPWKIPNIFIKDYPRFSYRGLQLDVARHFIPADQVKRLIDLMAIHKLNYLQWHLTDDEGWRIEIKKYPELTAKGAWRGYDPRTANEYTLLPAYGSGAKSYGGFYTQEEVRDIVQYAAKRHITIVPEIDLPGHARALIASLAHELIDTNDQSYYTSVQGYHDNILSPCNKTTFIVLENIISEIAQLFPGKYIHVGGDEVPQGVWEKSCMANKYDAKDPAFKDKVENNFMQRVQDIISSKGKIMAGWEEIANDNSILNAPLRINIWNTAKIDQVYAKATSKGYEVIMGPAENLYFDLAYSANTKEPGQYWAGYVDTFSAYSFTPIKKGQNDVVIKGVQGHLWSELIDSPARLDYLAFPKVAGLAELGWTPANLRNWKNFYERMREKHLPRLDYYGVKYRKTEFAEQPEAR